MTLGKTSWLLSLNCEFLFALRGQGHKKLRMVVLWQRQACFCQRCYSCPCSALFLGSLSPAPSILPFHIMAVSGWRVGFILSDAAVFLSLVPFCGCLLSVLFKLPRKCPARGLPHLTPAKSSLGSAKWHRGPRFPTLSVQLTYHIKHLPDNDVAGITLIEFHCTVSGRVGVGKIPCKIFSSSEDWLVKLGKPTRRLVLLKETCPFKGESWPRRMYFRLWHQENLCALEQPLGAFRHRCGGQEWEFQSFS